MRIVGFYAILLLVLILHTIHVGFSLFDRVVEALKEPNVENPVDTEKTGESTRLEQIEGNHSVRGIDISHWDGDIDWAELKKSGITFIYMKATQGLDFVDPKFRENWEEAKRYGFTCGAYHFFDPDEDGDAQAQLFLEQVNFESDDLLPVLDMEVASRLGKDKLIVEMDKWLNKVEGELGRRPMIYTDTPFWNAKVGVDRSVYPLWIADWVESEMPQDLPIGWDEYAYWQYSATGKVRGIDYPHVDLDISRTLIE